jgi:D-alanine transaminase
LARIAYVNGRYRPLDRPAVPVEERGFQFADGVYEVVKVVGGRCRDLERHIARLNRSLAALAIAWPMSPAAFRAVLAETLRRNGLRDALLYVQITRGAAPRDHLFPRAARPSLVVTVRRPKRPPARDVEQGVAVVTRPDERWARCDIKSISLLPNVLARQAAGEQGCREAWLIDPDRGVVTEGSGSNAYIVDALGRVRTHPLGPAILGGVTREVVLELARAAGIDVVEMPFTLTEAEAAPEAFMSSTSSWVLPVTRIDGREIADGRPGPVTRRLMRLYTERVRHA